MSKHFPLQLVSSHMLAPTVRHLAFRRADGEALDFIPGQFLQVHFQYEDGKPTKRSYSIATQRSGEAHADDLIEVAVSYVPGGAATDIFEHIREGDQIQASGPYGRFCLMPNDANPRYLLIATGTGVTPYRAMLPQLEKAIDERGLEVVLFFGARTPEEMLYAEDFLAFAERHPGFRFVPCFSRQMPETPRADDRQGYVQQHLVEFKPDPVRDVAYLCGNPNMVDACFEALKGFDFHVRSVRREKYVSSR